MSEVGRWIGQLGYDLVAGGLITSGDGWPSDAPFASELQAIFRPADGGPAVGAVFCVDKVPTVCLVDQAVLSSVEMQRHGQIKDLCERLWNQNLARAVLIVSKSGIEAWSVDNPRAEREQIKAVEQAKWSAWSAKGLLSGEVLKQHKDWFDPKQRVDKVLLDNITVLIERLSSSGMKPAAAREVIAKVIFVAYLEDRQIVSDDYRRDRKVRPLYDLLVKQDAAGLERLFAQLKEDFNGDFLKPNSKTGRTWHDVPKVAFDDLRYFLARTTLRSDQRDFWRYDFSQIPIELIAGIYEVFLASKANDKLFLKKKSPEGESENSKRKLGAYYTPRLLADWVVDLALDGRNILEQKIFDGACGSGMLLTAAYRRLIKAQQRDMERQNLGADTVGFEARCELLKNHIFGGDLDEDACRLTAFSLYLALLTDLAPRDLAVLRKGGHKLPELSQNLTGGEEAGNFFNRSNEAANAHRYTIFLSNPPWRELPASDPAAKYVEEWRRRQPDPKPRIPNRQIAAAFALAAADCLAENGRAVLILPVTPFLSAESTRRLFRADLLARYRIEQIVNFSDMRRLIFADAVHPFIVLVATAKPSQERYKSIAQESYEYWTPKTDVALAFGRLAVHGTDRARLPASTLIDEASHLTLRYWGSELDMALLQRLRRHGTIRQLIDEQQGWVDAKGFHSKDEDKRRPPESWYVEIPGWMQKRRFLDAKKFPADVPLLDPQILTALPFEKIARIPSKRLFEGPRVIWPDGTHPENGVKAIYTDRTFTFQHSLGVLSAPNTDSGRQVARFIACYLRSPLGIWLSLLLSASVASERPKLHIEELLEWPFWLPDNHPKPSEAREILDEVERVFALIEEQQGAFQPRTYEKYKPKLDDLVFRYFSFQEEEKILVRELAEYAGPSLQPTSLNYSALLKPLRAPPSEKLLDAYCGRVQHAFHRWRDVTGGNGQVHVSAWAAKTVPVGAAVISLRQAAGKKTAPSRLQDDSILGDLTEALERVAGQDDNALLSIPNLTIFDEGRIIVVKPLVSRFWLQRAAIEDVGRIVGEIQALDRARQEQ